MATFLLSGHSPARQPHLFIISETIKSFGSPFQESISASINLALRRFRLYLVADRGMGTATADNYVRMAAKVMRDTGSPCPGHDALREHVAAMRDAGYSHSYCANVCLVVEALTTHAGRPLKLARGRKPRPAPTDTLSEGEVAVIMAACLDPRERAVISILAYSGIRNNELCQLRVQDVLQETQQIRVVRGKGGAGRSVRIAGKCCTDVLAYLAHYPRRPTDRLFTSLRLGLPMEGATVRRMVRRVVARTMIRKSVHPHLFRHSLAMNTELFMNKAFSM